MGDIKLLAMIGAVLGWVAVPATVLIASLTGSAVGIPAILIRGRHLRPRAGMRVGAAVAVVTAAVLWIVEWRVSPVQEFWPPSLLPLALGLGVGALVGLLVTVRIAARRYPIPFGPFLALGALLSLFLDPQTFAWLMPWT
jgi:prepilin signal peptidase PulO-like enzyme (type II secretory pathway)